MTQINKMTAKLSKLTLKASDTPVVKTPGDSQEMKGGFPLWRLKKVSNSKENGVKMDIHLKTNPAECTACTSQVMGMLLSLLKRKSLQKTMPQRRVAILLLCLLHYLCLCQLLLLQNLTLASRQSFPFQNLFSQR
jgi:hypothetical protein